MTMSTQNLNEQLGLNEFNDTQKARFSDLHRRVLRREISANQAYKYAQADGDSPEDKGFRGSFKDWIENSKLKEWVSEPVKTENEENNKEPELKKEVTSERTLKDYLVPIGVGVIIAVVLVYAIKKFGKKE